MSIISPETADVQAVTEQVWTSFLGDQEPLIPRFLDPGQAFDADEVWSSAVSIGGGWSGIVTIELSAQVAVELTRVMLAFEEGDPISDEDVADAVGELVNMIGGNVKSLMPGPSVLTLPIVAAGRAAHASDAVEVARVDAIWAGEPVRVSVHTRASE
jgi:chemotaxis protein CheX